MGDKRAVVDEFQHVPALIPTIGEASHRLDPHKKGKFLLTGSADLFRSARMQESLPGRMARLELLLLSVTERDGQPLNVIDPLAAGEFTDIPAASATREDHETGSSCGGVVCSSRSKKARKGSSDRYENQSTTPG